MMYSIAISVYNRLPILKQCLRAALASTGDDTEIILVNNHPPYLEVQIFLRRLRHPRVRVLDPGRNLGCHQGNNYAFLRARGRYLVKLDDDIIVPRNNWLAVMRRALIETPSLAYIILPWHKPTFQRRQPIINRRDYRVKLWLREPAIFGCVMIRRDLWRKHFFYRNPGLYGWEEHFFLERINKLGKKQGFLLSHPCRHLCRTRGTDPLYGVWKVLYAYKYPDAGLANFPLWRKSFQPTLQMVEFLRQKGYTEVTIEQLHSMKAKLKGG